jgi:DNA repair exonuclease SbcCD ATPase subunit
MIFIDEGFGSLDRDNFIEIAKVLKQLKQNFDAMFIITHITELKTYADFVLDISRVNNFSKLHGGEISMAESEMALIIQKESRAREVAKYRAEVKSAKSARVSTSEKKPRIKKIKSEEELHALEVKKEQKLNEKEMRRVSEEKQIEDYLERTGDLQTALIISISNKVFRCSGCDSEFKNMNPKTIEKHITAKRYAVKHRKFLLSCISDALSAHSGGV